MTFSPVISRRSLVSMLLSAPAAMATARLNAAQPLGNDAYVDKWVLPELRPIARGILANSAGEAPLSLSTLEKRRELLAGPAALPSIDLPLKILRIPGQNGAPDVIAYLINAKPNESRPAIVHSHGGGFVAGSARAAIPSQVALSREIDCAIMTVEYRLAPEVTWAGAIEDNYAALKWLHLHAGELGIDPSRIAVMGESAGGGHAALLAITARDRGEVPVAFQCLTYPMLDDRTGSSRKVPDHVGRIIWSAQDNRFGWASFLGGPPGGRNVPFGAVPARCRDLSNLPPAFIGVGSLDLFHDEDVEYAQRLNDAGVQTQLIVVPGAFHVFDAMPAAISRWFSSARTDALHRGLGISTRTQG